MSQKKQIFKLSNLRKLLNDVNSCVSLVPSTRLLALPPFFLNDMKSGIFYFLNNILKKYDRSLDGIVIGYQNVKILMDENTGIIPIGSAETEVNVSVEFYIFQPKIGNTLEGVINKISNNHIGCLVHKYFNATILKPEDVEYEDWNCKDFDVNDTIVFKVKDLDFTGLLPYIEGTVTDELFSSKRTKRVDGCDLDVEKDLKRKIASKSPSLLNSFIESEKDQSLIPSTKKCLNNTNKESKSDDSHVSKKKKKKEKNSTDDSGTFSKTNEEENVLSDFILQKYLQGDSDDNNFVKPVKSKKEKKRKKDEDPKKKISEDTPQHEFFYSTQLEPNSASKMDTSCSPIPKRLSGTNNEQSVKKKNRKRKAEDSGDASSAKKVKKDMCQINGISEFVDELLRQELNNVKKELNMSEKKPEREKGEREFLYEKLLDDVKNDIAPERSKGNSHSISKKKKKHKERKLKNGSMYDVEMTPEKVSADKSLFSDSEQSNQSPLKKKSMNGVGRKSLVQTMLDQFFKDEGMKLKSDSDKESLKKESATPKTLPEESLFEKLLREAKSRIELAEDSPPRKKRKMK